MGIKDVLMGLLGKARGVVADNVKERISDAVGDHIPDSLSDAKDAMDEVLPDEKQ